MGPPVRRALPTLLAIVALGGLLAAAVLASPESDGRGIGERAGGKESASPLGLMRNGAVDHAPELEDFEPPPASPPARRKPPEPPQLAPVQDLQPDKPVRPSRSVGQPWNGRLRNGVMFPESGGSFFTFDSARRTSPSDWWRRWGTDKTVARTLAVVRAFHAAHPDAPRVAVGDLSLPRGGPFGREYGGLGHKSHQSGVDVDIYYPRKDREETAPDRPSQVDRALSQDLVNRFVAAGAKMVFVGPRVGLRGPRGVVMRLAHHDNHLHVRWPRR